MLEKNVACATFGSIVRLRSFWSEKFLYENKIKFFTTNSYTANIDVLGFDFNFVL